MDEVVERPKDERTVEERLAAAVIAIDSLSLSVEVVGSWLWLSGDTKPYKEALKAAGFRWAPKKQRWYFPGKPAAPWARGKLEMEEIRRLHGSAWLRGKEDAA